MNFVSDSILKKTCIGNALSSINSNFSALDINLATLSSYSHSSINYLSAFDQALQTQVNGLLSSYNSQVQIYQQSNGNIAWDLSVGTNAYVVLSANGNLLNPTNFYSGINGHLSIESNGTSGYSLTGYGDKWTMTNNLSSMRVGISANNLIDYYYNGKKLLATLHPF